MSHGKRTALVRLLSAVFLLRLWIAVFRPSPQRVIGAFACGAIWYVMLRIPFACIISTLIATPMLMSIPGFDRTSKHVTYWFMGVIPESEIAAIVFYLYYSLVAYLLLFPLMLFPRRESGIEPN